MKLMHDGFIGQIVESRGYVYKNGNRGSDRPRQTRPGARIPRLDACGRGRPATTSS